MSKPILATLFCLFVASNPAAAEVYLYGFSGLSFTQDSDLTIRQPGQGTDFTLDNASYMGEAFAKPPYYGGGVGYYFENDALRPFGVQLDFIHYKVIADTDAKVKASGTDAGVPVDGSGPLGDYLDGFEISNGVNYLTLSAVARHGFLSDDTVPQGRVQLYGGLGLAAVRMVADVNLKGEGRSISQKATWDGPGYAAFVGSRFLPVSLASGVNLALFTEYRFTYVDAKVPAPSGSAKLAIATHHLIFGAGLHF